MVRVIAPFFALILATSPTDVLGAAAGHGCSAGSGKTDQIVDRSWVQSRLPLFVIDAEGRLWRGDLGRTVRVLISNHGFKHQPSAVRSADGRFVIYGGQLLEAPLYRWWLLELATATERVIHESPATHSGLPELSPDGEWISFHYSSAWLPPGVGQDNSRMHVASGTYDNCAGITIGIHGWFDDRYLVYSLDDIAYLVDPETERQAPLLDDGNGRQSFFW